MFATGRIHGAYALVAVLVMLLAVGCERGADRQVPRKQPESKVAQMDLTSSAFAQGQPIPRKYTADGDDVSPPLSWSELPPAAVQLALVVDDPDAPTAEPWVHWVLYAIPGHQRSLPEGTGRKGKRAEGLLEGKNSWDQMGWGGPSPPQGHGVHHYHFKLYALDETLELKSGLRKAELLGAMEGHTVGTGELVGTYERR